MKRLKNIEGKNEQQLELIKNQREKQLNLIHKSNLERETKQLEIQSYLNPEAKRLKGEINKEMKDKEDKNVLCTHSNGKEYNFYKFATLNLFGNKIFDGKTSIEDALEEQAKMEKLLMSLKKHDPSNDYKIKTRKEFLKNAENLLETRNKIINGFRDGIFPLAKDVQKKQTKVGNLDWMHRPSNELRDLIEKIKSSSNLGATINGKKITLSNIEDSLNNILSGKIDIKYDAEKKYRKRIQEDKKLLRASKYPQGGKRWKLLDIIDGVKYTVFGVMFPTDEKQPETIDMSSELELKNLLNKKIKKEKY